MREILIKFWIGYLLFVYLATEILSLFNQINRFSLYIAYILMLSILTFFFFKNRKFWICFFKERIEFIKDLGTYSYVYFGLLIFVLLPVLFLSIYAAPNNWDSMTYHLGRMMHWIQNQNIEHYPTHISRQLFNPPLAEYVMMHFYILTNGDQFLNMVQGISFIGSILIVSLFAKIMGMQKDGQLIASICAATIPMAILQASNTKNELTVAFFVVASLYYLVLYFKNNQIKNVFFSAVSISLCLLTKGTAVIYLLPSIPIILLMFLVNRKYNSLLRILFINFAIVLLITTPFYLRNYKTYGHPLGATKEERSYYKNNILGLKPTVSNIIRNTGIHIMNVYLFDSDKIFRKMGEAYKNYAIKIHNRLEIDILDGNTTWGGTGFDVNVTRDEDYAGNLLHFILAIIAFVYILIKWKHNNIIQLALVCSTFLVALFFCFYLKWQPWHSRLHTTIFIMACPFIAYFISTQNKWVSFIILFTFIAGSVSYIFENETRKLLFKNPKVYDMTRNEVMFTKKGAQTLKNNIEVCTYILDANFKNIGFIIGEDSWEYPVWKFIKERNPNIRIEHLEVSERSTPFTVKRDLNFVPDIILVMNNTISNNKFGIKVFNEDKNFGDIKVWE